MFNPTVRILFSLLKHNTPSSSYVNYELFFPMLKHLYYIYSEKARETPHLQKKEQPVDQLLFQEKVFFTSLNEKVYSTWQELILRL